MNSNDLKIIFWASLGLFGVLLFVGVVTWAEVWFKRDVLGVPYCIGGK